MISTFLSLTSSSYEPYAAAPSGTLHSWRNFLARSAEEEDATALTSCLTSETSRVEGSRIKSFTNTVAS